MTFFTASNAITCAPPSPQRVAEVGLGAARGWTRRVSPRILPVMTSRLLVLLLALQVSALAKEPKPQASTGEFAGGTKEQDASQAPELIEKPKAFTATVTALTASGFVCQGKGGVKLTHTFNASTVVQQGKTAAKTTDIQVGDVVTGTRTTVSDSEFVVVKITKFVHAPAKPDPAKPKKK